MSGINGFIKNKDKDEISMMNRSILHRGPEMQGYFSDCLGKYRISFGAVTNSIISQGEDAYQPMYYSRDVGAFSTEKKNEYLGVIGKDSIRIVFDGEIYNYQEIKKILINKGYTFSCNSDVEVVLASYLEWGNLCVKKFNGIRAFAIFDPNKKCIFCSRDILGKKPFYYYFDGKQFIFSSELKGIIVHSELKINNKENINLEAIDFYLASDYIPAPRTIYKNVKKLEARNSLLVSIDDNQNLQIKKECYYEIPKYEPCYDKNLLIKSGKDIMEKTIKNLIPKDKLIGANLSGGIDSSIVVAEMSKWISSKNLYTFSIGFDGKHDESKYSDLIKEKFKTNHHKGYFKEEYFESMINNIYYYYDEPFADNSIFPTMFVSKLAKEYVPVVMTGNCGDEIFGGFPMHKRFAYISFIKKVPKKIRKFCLCAVPNKILFWSNSKLLCTKIKEGLRLSLLPENEIFGDILGSNVYIPEIYKEWTKEKFNETLKLTDNNLIQAMIDFDLFYNTTGNNYLLKTDRASMAYSIENRTPFCDKMRIEWSMICPTKWKVNLKNQKILMKKICKREIPDKIINKKKNGFQPPIISRLKKVHSKYNVKPFFNYLVENNLLSESWQLFFEKQVFKNQRDPVYVHYFLRLFFLKLWYETWIIK